jgi:hypothetical protein
MNRRRGRLITHEVLVEKILAYLNHRLTEAELVRWAEDALVVASDGDADIPNEGAVLHVLAYLGAADTPGFPLSWSALTEFLARFGVKVQVVTTAG